MSSLFQCNFTVKCFFEKLLIYAVKNRFDKKTMRCFPTDTIKICKPLSMQFSYEMLFVGKITLKCHKRHIRQNTMRCFPTDTIKIRKPLSMQFSYEMLFVEKSRLNVTKDIFDKK